MNITEANEVNLLLDWITGTPGPAGAVTEERAREAAAVLADRAHRALMAGLDWERLLAAWPMPIGVCPACPTRVPVAELVDHLRDKHDVVAADHAALAQRHAGILGQATSPVPGQPEPAGDGWDQISVGDPDPTPDFEPWCQAPRGTVECTRKPHDAGPHVSGDGHRVLAVWS